MKAGSSCPPGVLGELGSPWAPSRWGYRERSAAWHPEEGSWQNSPKLLPWPRTSSWRNCEKEASVVCKPLALGALLQQPKLTMSQGAARPCRIFSLSRFPPVLESGARLVTKRDTLSTRTRGVAPQTQNSWGSGQNILLLSHQDHAVPDVLVTTNIDILQ